MMDHEKQSPPEMNPRPSKLIRLHLLMINSKCDLLLLIIGDVFEFRHVNSSSRSETFHTQMVKEQQQQFDFEVEGI